ncbi:MAG: hypothetical protein FK733_17885 [Asgard group archaeon]|nr:hypothetical protein [Asgard group archaeon]
MPIISIIIILGFTSFLAFMISGMVIYEGGNFIENDYPKYNFTRNYISDIGRDFTYTGELNTIPQLMFQLAMMAATVSIVSIYAFFIHLLRKFEEKNKLGITGSIFGFFSTIFCTSIAFVPYDTMVELHRLCVYFFGGLVLTANILHIITFFKIEDFPNKYRAIFIVCSTLLLVYIIIYSALGPDAPDLQEIVKIVAQKIVIGATFINLGVQAYGLNRGLNKYNRN